MKNFARATYYKTSYMLQKHYRQRWLTTHFQTLIDIAEHAAYQGTPEALDDLLEAIIQAKNAVKAHGYKKRGAA